MAMLNYQQEAALFSLNHSLDKPATDYDYFEMFDLFRQLETEGLVHLNDHHQNASGFSVQKTSKGEYYHYNWIPREFR